MSLIFFRRRLGWGRISAAVHVLAWSVMFRPDPIQAHHHWAQEYLRVRVSVTTTTSSLRLCLL
jgi:hypothetical protein